MLHADLAADLVRIEHADRLAHAAHRRALALAIAARPLAPVSRTFDTPSGRPHLIPATTPQPCTNC